MSDTWQLGGVTLASRLMLALPEDADLTRLPQILRASGTEIVTARTDRVGPDDDDLLLGTLRDSAVHVLPNTEGAHDAAGAVQAALHGAELVGRRWVKLIISDDPDHHVPKADEILVAARELVRLGFEVAPLIPDDPGLAQALADLGCAAVMPQGSPVGSGQGIANPLKFEIMIDRLDVPIIVGAGIGTAADTVRALEIGCDGVASAKVVFGASDPVAAARTLGDAVATGRRAHLHLAGS
ncbi:hypothetical protein [Actinomadura flavalba]|uniref:hypothetical protein n=1 Tax=Actinomadura flavalba TaxID=1120938 RepID=UPI00036F86F5|nr:hypothetical protein [Actinomadura flavalba]